MQQLIDVIRAAIATDATTEQKAAGVLACRTIATALDTEPGKPLALPGLAPMQGGARVSVDQVLDLVIARLNILVTDRERAHALPQTTESAESSLATISPTVTQPTVPRGLRVPLATSSALKVMPRHPSPPKGASRPSRAPSTLRKP